MASLKSPDLPSNDVTLKKFKHKSASFFLIEARRLSAYLEGLNSSLAPSVGKLSLGKHPEKTDLCFSNPNRKLTVLKSKQILFKSKIVSLLLSYV